MGEKKSKSDLPSTSSGTSNSRDPNEVLPFDEGINEKRPNEPEILEVERILDKIEYEDGRVMYLLRWKGFDESEDTWEPPSNLDCPDLIAEFERKLKEASAVLKPNKKKSNKKTKNGRLKNRNEGGSTSFRASNVLNSSTSLKQTSVAANEQEDSDLETPYGFERGLEPEHILGATDDGGRLKFLIKWKDFNKPDIVLAEEANLKCPQLVISYYESRLTWSSRRIPSLASN